MWFIINHGDYHRVFWKSFNDWSNPSCKMSFYSGDLWLPWIFPAKNWRQTASAFTIVLPGKVWNGVFIEFLQGFRQTRGNTKISQVFCICLCVVSFLMSRPESDSTMVSSQGVRELKRSEWIFWGVWCLTIWTPNLSFLIFSPRFSL